MIWFLSCLPIELFCQIDSLKTISLDVHIMVNGQNKVMKDLNSFLEANKIVPDKMNETELLFISNFVLTESAYYEFVEKIENWGIIRSRRIESVNYSEKLEAVNDEFKRLQDEIEDYEVLLQKVEVKSESHVRYWEKLEATKEQLRIQQDLQKEYLGSNKKFKVELQVEEENLMTLDPDFSFVNMPGIQYSFFKTTNSKDGIYPESMNGFSIKYLMNRQKTYLELGLFKSIETNELQQFDELYKFGFGQDFYSTHLGRGRRRFLNLYSGFKAGVFIFTGKEDNLISWYATPSVGLEISKTKNILLDSKVGYFLPFKENRNIRGFLVEASFNIVF